MAFHELRKFISILQIQFRASSQQFLQRGATIELPWQVIAAPLVRELLRLLPYKDAARSCRFIEVGLALREIRDRSSTRQSSPNWNIGQFQRIASSIRLFTWQSSKVSSSGL
jgi:hypothetical protein